MHECLLPDMKGGHNAATVSINIGVRCLPRWPALHIGDPPETLDGQLVDGRGNIAGAMALSLACTAADELMTVRP